MVSMWDGARDWPRRICAFSSHWFAQEWASVLFVVALITALHSIWPLKAISHVSLLILSNLQAGVEAPSPSGDESDTWIIGISPDDFEIRFSERRPLSRCVIAEDLQKILEGGPAVLAIDLDLSPLLSPSPEETCCQAQLDKLLDGDHATQLVVLDPFDSASETFSIIRNDWKKARVCQAKKLEFADSNIDYPLGVAIEYVKNPRGLAELAWEKNPGTPKNSDSKHGDHGAPINYAAFQRLTHIQTSGGAKYLFPGELQNKTVFYGSLLNTDPAKTPIGELSGIYVHAAKYTSFKEPLKAIKWVTLALDLLIALAFSYFIEVFFEFYRNSAHENTPRARAIAGVKTLFFVLMYIFAVCFTLWIASLLIKHGNIVTEPLLIAVGLALDGFVISSWSRLGAIPEANPGHSPAPRQVALPPLAVLSEWCQTTQEIAKQSLLLALWESARWLIFWAVIIYAIHGLMG